MYVCVYLSACCLQFDILPHGMALNVNTTTGFTAATYTRFCGRAQRTKLDSSSPKVKTILIMMMMTMDDERIRQLSFFIDSSRTYWKWYGKEIPIRSIDM